MTAVSLEQSDKEFAEALLADGRRLDLHGFPTCEAVQLAEWAVATAWEQGWPDITLIHEAPDVRHWRFAQIFGRGSIKWSLRGSLARGDWNQYVFPRRSARHVIDDGSMTLAVRKAT